jgi:hypothetical protein
MGLATSMYGCGRVVSSMNALLRFFGFGRMLITLVINQLFGVGGNSCSSVGIFGG